MTGTVIAVISDTHGVLRPEAAIALHGADLILHAGDIGSLEILDALREIAPVYAVRGNVDREPWALSLPTTEVIDVSGKLVYMLHDLNALDLDPASAGFVAVISGHSHQPSIDWNKDVLYLNPGSAGPRRFKLPVTVARLRVGERIDAEIVTLRN